MVAAARQFYCGRQLRAGDQFECSEEEAADLETLRFAIRDKSPVPRPGTYNRRDLRARK